MDLSSTKERDPLLLRTLTTLTQKPILPQNDIFLHLLIIFSSHHSRPSSYKCRSLLLVAPGIPSRSGCRYISEIKRCQSVGGNLRFVTFLSLTLMTGTFGLNLADSWLSTSVINCWCLRIFLVFMILTMAAWISNFLSSSMCLCVISISCFCSVFIGMLMFTRSFLFLYPWNRQIIVSMSNSSLPPAPSDSDCLSLTSSFDLRRIWRTCINMSRLI